MHALIPDETRTDREVGIQAGDLEPHVRLGDRIGGERRHDLRSPSQRQHDQGISADRVDSGAAGSPARAPAPGRRVRPRTRPAKPRGRPAPRPAPPARGRARSSHPGRRSGSGRGPTRPPPPRRTAAPPAPRSARGPSRRPLDRPRRRGRRRAPARPRASGLASSAARPTSRLSATVARARAARSRAPRLPPSSTVASAPRLTTHGDGCCGPATWCSTLPSTPGLGRSPAAGTAASAARHSARARASSARQAEGRDGELPIAPPRAVGRPGVRPEPVEQCGIVRPARAELGRMPRGIERLGLISRTARARRRGDHGAEDRVAACVRRAGETAGGPSGGIPDPRGCRSAWWRDRRGRASPAPRAGRRRLPAGGSRSCAAGCAA